jgi:hypothetical protein
VRGGSGGGDGRGWRGGGARGRAAAAAAAAATIREAILGRHFEWCAFLLRPAVSWACLADGRCPCADVADDVKAAAAFVELFGEPSGATAGLEIRAAGEENGRYHTEIGFNPFELLLKVEHRLVVFVRSESQSQTSEHVLAQLSRVTKKPSLMCPMHRSVHRNTFL